jgi:hypothetical protein
MFQLVRNDSAPQIKATVTREDSGAVVDMSGGTVRMRFRAKGSATVLSTLMAADAGDNFQNGIAIFSFTANDLADVTEGYYEGEIEIEYSTGLKETIFEVLDFYVREDF